jgi:N-acetylmuramoyl-L-alanine amidase
MTKQNKSIVGVIAFSVISAIGVLFYEPQPINTNSNQLQGVMVHTSASREGRDVKAKQIVDYHLRPKDKGGRGWSKPGYSDIIELNGNLVNVISYDDDQIITYREISNGAVGYNRVLRHVCYIGGLDSTGKKAKNTLTPNQDSTLKYYVFDFIEKHPYGWVMGHNQVANKACPSFDVPTKMREYGIPEQHIYTKEKAAKWKK